MIKEATESFINRSRLADVGMYLGIERQDDGFAVVIIKKEKDGVSSKKTIYGARKQKALAMEGFKLASGQFIIDFNQSKLGDE